MRRAPARPVRACFVRSCCSVAVQEHDLRATPVECKHFPHTSHCTKIKKICWQITFAALMQPFQYDLRSSAAKDNSITHAAAAPSNLDAATTMRSAETELQNTIELRAMASEIAAPKPDGSRRQSDKKTILTHFLISPSSSLPFFTASLRHHFPSSPLPFLTTSLRHHSPSSSLPQGQFHSFLFFCYVLVHYVLLYYVLLYDLPPFLKVNFIASYWFVMYWYIMYCYRIYHPSS